MPNSSLATVEEDGCVIRSKVQVLSPVGTREVTVVPATFNQTRLFSLLFRTSVNQSIKEQQSFFEIQTPNFGW